MDGQNVQGGAICCNAAISACDKAGEWQKALLLLWGKAAVDGYINEFCCNSAISACGRAGMWELALWHLAAVSELSLVPTDMNYSAAISGCERGSQWERALVLLGAMPAAGLQPTAFSFSSVIAACEGASEWQASLSFLELMDRQRMPPDTISWTAAMGACVKAARWEDALDLLVRMSQQQMEVDRYCFNAAASACEKGDRWDVALSVLAMMNVRRLPPEIVTYNAAMASCKRNGLWEAALQLMEQAKAASQPPDAISFNCLIGTCHLAGRWDLSLHFLSAMQPSALTPDRSSYTEAAGACEKSSQWQHALEVLSSALSQQLVPDGTCVGAVAGALRSAQGEEAALGLLQQLRKRWSPENAEPENFGGGIPVLAKRPGVLVVSKPEGLSTEDMLERLFGNRWQNVVQTVSRLDYPTSGVLPIALGPEGSAECSWLQAQFAAKLVKKEYLCLALGPFLGEVGDEGAITKPLRTVGVGSLRTEVSPSGRYARTGYRILRRFAGADSSLEPKLLLAMPETGRTHQIRVHLASLDQPLVGDQTCLTLTYQSISLTPYKVLVFVNSEYGDHFPSLPGTRKDAEVLENCEFVQGAASKRRYDNLSAADMKRKLHAWMNTWETNGKAMFFYFGHGMYYEDRNAPCTLHGVCGFDRKPQAASAVLLTRAVVVAALVMGLTIGLQVLLVSFLSTSTPYENTPCPILHEFLPFVDERLFLGIKLVTLVGIQLIVIGLSGKISQSPVAGLLMPPYRVITAAWHIWNFTRDFRHRPTMDRVERSLNAVQHLFFGFVQWILLAYVNEAGFLKSFLHQTVSGKSCSSHSAVHVLALQMRQECKAIAKALRSSKRLAAQVCTLVGEIMAYRTLTQIQLQTETDFKAFRRQFVNTLCVLMYINLTEILEQLVLLIRHRYGHSGAEVEFFDAEISIFQYFISETLPLLVMIFNTPDWRARHRPNSGLWLTTTSPWVVKGFLWLGWWQFFLWGVHMSCHPKVASKALDGGILFVLARASAASIYFDLIVLFFTIWPGVKLVLQSCIGIGMSTGFTTLHMMIGKRILICASVHAVSHVVWVLVDGFADGESVYSRIVWDGKVLLPEVPFLTGTMMLAAFVLAYLAHVCCKQRSYDTFRSIHRTSAGVVLVLGIFHSLTGVLGAPALFVFCLVLLCMWLLDSRLTVCRHLPARYVHFCGDGDDQTMVLVLELCGGLQTYMGYVQIEVPGIPGWHPFTVVVHANGTQELHINLKARREGSYVNWAWKVEREVAWRTLHPGDMEVHVAGAFPTVLGNRDLYRSFERVVFISGGTGFTGCQQGLFAMHSNLGQDLGNRVAFFWRGKQTMRYHDEKIGPCCQEFGVRSENLSRYSRDQFWQTVSDRVQQFNRDMGNDDKVLVCVCGDSSLFAAASQMFESRNRVAGDHFD
ncbi:unnamed protein product [Symbiodinium sp. CCMP2592]|nr:unnamed protein product [Symbiodinium sp. CCMP2592]